MKFTFDILEANGETPCDVADVRVIYQDGSEDHVSSHDLSQTIEVSAPVEAVIVAPKRSGTWGPLVFSPPAPVLSARCVPIEARMSHWWHALHNVDTALAERGAGVRIGVVDEALASEFSDISLSNIRNCGAEAWRAPPGIGDRAYAPRTYHSEAICRILCGKGHQALPPGIAPGAEVVFMSAASDTSEKLDVSRVARCIDALVEHHECDLVMFSAGDHVSGKALSPVTDAAQDAWEQGTLCLVASGNLGGTPRWPAASRSCIAVAVVGACELAPGPSWEWFEETKSPGRFDTKHFVWRSNALGSDVELLAGGIGIIAHRAVDGAAVACSGTSFSCPVATGILATRLSLDPQYSQMRKNAARSAHVHRVLREICVPCPGVSIGLPRL